MKESATINGSGIVEYNLDFTEGGVEQHDPVARTIIHEDAAVTKHANARDVTESRNRDGFGTY
jgi:hypothetical protein